uniref:Chromo domain-containing protein n=1 Tax=Elaeophora elaphi TaxID=1147741 RepID=A0A0R3S4N4_9BILA
MADSSWYRVERILSEKYEKKGARLEKFYEILWAPTWEPAKRINAQVPLIVEEYEKQKQKGITNIKSSETGIEPLEATAKHGAQGSKRTRNSVTLPPYIYKKIKVIGVVNDNGRNVKNSTLLVENECSGEQWCMRYEDIKKDYSIELIDFFEECVSGFT